jgi:hypothetical protein
MYNLVGKMFLIVEYTGSTSKQAGPLPSLAFGAIAGMLGQSSSYPLDIVRRRMQTSPISGTQYKTIVGTLKKIYRYNKMRRDAHIFLGYVRPWEVVHNMHLQVTNS